MAENESIARALSRLVTDGAFQRFAVMQAQPNLLRAVGRTHTETWHSAFLGWLLDPLGSHGLGSFPLQRFWSTVADLGIPPDDTPQHFLSADQLAHLAAAGDLGEAAVLPNERIASEYTFSGGRADTWIELSEGDQDSAGFLGMVEMKIDSALSENQAKKYADHVASRVSNGIKAACVFVARTEDLFDTSVETTDDGRWYCIDFQILHDALIEPCFSHPNLNPQMRPLVGHYLLNMRDSSGPKGRMAITKEERELALDIYQRHLSTFQELAKLLKEEEGFPAPLIPADGGEQLPLSLIADGVPLVGNTVPEFYVAVFDFLYKTKKVIIPLPFSTGKKRYLLAEEAIHPTGKPFFSARQYVRPTGSPLNFEAHFSRDGALASARKVLSAMGCAVS